MLNTALLEQALSGMPLRRAGDLAAIQHHIRAHRVRETLSPVAGVGDAGPRSAPAAPTSVHLQLFPDCKVGATDDAVRQQIDQLLRLRGVIGQALEKARQEKLIGNSLEARVTLKCDRKTLGSASKEELEEFFILSDLIIEDADEVSASVEKTPYAKCARCWRHRETVGQSTVHPDLCDRCVSVVTTK